MMMISQNNLTNILNILIVLEYWIKYILNNKQVLWNFFSEKYMYNLISAEGEMKKIEKSVDHTILS